NSANRNEYEYDALDRLWKAKRGTPASLDHQFDYDAVGNRAIHTTVAGVTNYSYSTTSNRLDTLSGVTNRSYTYDGAGNRYSVAGLIYDHNNANRLRAITSGATTIGNYKVNALGQRVQKTVGVDSTTFVYDEQGHLLGEYDATGNLIQET